jgi:uncharacterized protein (TIGR02598 family)
MKHRDLNAFSLVEVTLALGVAAFCLLAIFGLLPVGLNSNKTSVEQTAAASLARAFVADLRATPITSSTTATFGITFPTSTSVVYSTIWLDESGAKVTTADSPKYRAYITLTPPPNATPKAATFVRMLISWPALADLNATADPVNAAGTFESVTAIDRN